MNNIILASASPRRKELLEQIGVKFSILPCTREEVITESNPAGIVKQLAKQKALDVAAQTKEGSIVIGADTIVVHNGEIMGKPKSCADAARMLKRLENSTHTVYTGAAIYIKKGEDSKLHVFSEATNVTMYPMSEADINYYIATNEPMDKAGAYGIQGIGAIFIKRVDGDYNNVVGLPIGRLYHEMSDLGYDLLEIVE